MGVDTSKMNRKDRAQYEHARSVATSAARAALNELIESSAVGVKKPYAYALLKEGAGAGVGVVLLTIDPQMIAPVVGFAAEMNRAAQPPAPGTMALAEPPSKTETPEIPAPSTEPPRDVAAEFRQAIEDLGGVSFLADQAYALREIAAGDDDYEGDSWEHPKLKAYARGIEKLKILMRESA